jgi:uncharacterized protein
MRRLASRFRRLDGALADLPLEQPMLLTELDGLLTGVLVSPVPIAAEEWLPIVWGEESDGVPVFEDPLDIRWFRDAMIARRDDIGRDLARGRFQPILDVDDRSGDVLWEPWVDGFAEAMALRLDAWQAIADGPDDEAADAIASLSELIAVARGESALDTPTINALDATAPTDLSAAVLRLYAASVRRSGPAAASAPPTSLRTGRNAPCRCGSGKKSKRCCG